MKALRGQGTKNDLQNCYAHAHMSAVKEAPSFLGSAPYAASADRKYSCLQASRRRKLSVGLFQIPDLNTKRWLYALLNRGFCHLDILWVHFGAHI